MTKRDLLWRGLGAAFLAIGSGFALLVPDESKGPHGVLAFACMALTVLGILFLVQGKKLPLALRVESGPHRMLPTLIRQRRGERRVKRHP